MSKNPDFLPNLYHFVTPHCQAFLKVIKWVNTMTFCHHFWRTPMKAILAVATLAVLMTGCNTVTTVADNIMKKESSFSQEPNTIYPTVNGAKDGEDANFGKQQF